MDFIICLSLCCGLNFFCGCAILFPKGGVVMAEYHFDFSFVRSGPPVVTLSATGIAFNVGARALLGHPCAHNPSSNSEPFEFEGRQKDGWVRINAKDFSRYLEQQTGIRFREKAKQFLPEFDESNKMLIVILDEEHLK